MSWNGWTLRERPLSLRCFVLLSSSSAPLSSSVPLSSSAPSLVTSTVTSNPSTVTSSTVKSSSPTATTSKSPPPPPPPPPPTRISTPTFDETYYSYDNFNDDDFDSNKINFKAQVEVHVEKRNNRFKLREHDERQDRTIQKIQVDEVRRSGEDDIEN